jgi:molecular chaperone GrpE
MPDETPETNFPADGEAPSTAEGGADPFVVLQNLQRENGELKDRLLRTLADMENMRRRTEKEVSDAKLYGVSSFARDMLSFADNLRRAVDNIPDELHKSTDSAIKTLIGGIEVIERDFISRLARHGAKKMEPLGTKFDPNMHEALYEVPDETVPNGTVVKVVEDGYTIGDRMLRPAKVGISRGGAKSAN